MTLVEPKPTLADAWEPRVCSAAKLLHKLLGRAAAGSLKPKEAISPSVMLRLLAEIAAEQYFPDSYFQHGPEAEPLDKVRQSPPLRSGAEYVMISMNASTARGKFVSVDAGGVLFEDPVWAVLAAYAVSRKAGVAVPLAGTSDELWTNATALEAAVLDGSFQPASFLGPIEGFLAPERSVKFEAVTINAGQLAAMRDRGVQSIGGPGKKPRFFELFARPAR